MKYVRDKGFVQIVPLLVIAAIAALVITVRNTSIKNEQSKVQGLEIARGDNSGGDTSGSSGGADSGSDVKNESITTDSNSGSRGGTQTSTNSTLRNETETEKPESEVENEIEVEHEASRGAFPLRIATETGQVFVRTGNGEKEIRILPSQASEIATGAGIINKIDSIQSEVTNGQTLFVTKGTKSGKLFGIIPFEVPVSVTVNSQSGRVESVTQPFWLKLLANFVK